MILPERFKERMTDLLGGEEASALFESIEQGGAVRAFRVNNIKMNIDSFESHAPQIDRKKVDFPPDAYITHEEFPGSLPTHHAGAIYMQDISAMSTIHAAEYFEGMRVLDSCSAPGGKTTQLAALVGESGTVVANEYERKRCRILQSNVERMGAKNTVICNLDTAVLAETYPEEFDLVLCDAPCSGEGMFRKNPRAVEEWSEENVKMCAERQREILGNVARCVKAGGKLLYSTCTFSLEENEENVAWFLDTHPDFELIKVNDRLKNATSSGISLENCTYDTTMCRRIYPHRSLGEGQFIALFERKSGSDISSVPCAEKKKRGRERENARPSRESADMLRCAGDFLRDGLEAETYNNIYNKMKVFENSVCLSPEISLPAYGVVMPGVCAGECVKGRFIPHHQLFSAYGTEFKLRIILSGESDEAQKYLRGEEICVNGILDSSDGRSSGWAAVIIDGCAVGGAKISGGVAKNHYPKGLRD